MTTMRTLMLLAAGMGAMALGGCGADVPEHPTWQNDVYPIMQARCVRCHNAGKTMDPLSLPGMPVLGNFDSPSFDQFATLDKSLFFLAPDLISNRGDPKTMPPLPAAALAQWQIDTITRFVNDNKPAQ